MMLTKDEWMRGAGKWMGLGLGWGLLLMGTLLGQLSNAQAVSTTTVQGTVYLANGQTGAGTLSVSWPSFTTANGLAVAAGRTSVTIAPDGFMSVNLAPNVGATPAGLYYTAIYQMSDGERNTEYWVVPAAAQAALGQVRAQLMPAAQAVQAVSKSYVDQSVAELTQSLLTASGGSLSGPLYLNADPSQALQAATKHYVDTAVGTAVPLAGGNMTGALQTPAVNGVQAPAAGSAQTTLQAAMTAAGTNGAMTIPPTYAGTDSFTNPNGVRVTDLRTSGAQQAERSVKEFGAVCDGVTDDTNALQSALNYANAHGVALTIPQGTCKTRSLNWHGESIGGLGKQVSALLGFPGQDVLATVADSTNVLSYTRIHDLTIYVDQSADASCSAAEGRAAAGSCAVSRPMESNSIFSMGGNGQTGTAGTGAGWSVGNCAIAMPAATGAGGNGLKVAEIENVEIVATGTDPLAAQYPGAHSTHTCGLYLGQWPQWSEFRNIDIRGLNTGVAIPALAGTAPAGLNADSNRWQNITIQATHAFTAAAGSNNVLDNVVALAGNSAATGETPTGLVLDLAGTQQGWTVRNAMVIPSWNAVQPQLTVTAAGGAVTGVTAGPELGLGFDPYGTQVALKFSGSCTAQAVAAVNANGSIGAISVTQGGVGCSGTTTASVNAAGTWDTAAPVNLIGGQNMTFYAGNLLKGMGGYTVWNAMGSGIYGTQLDGGGGTQPGGSSYAALVANSPLGTTLQVDQFPGADFGAKVQACVNAVSAQYGGDCDARNFTGTLAMGSNLTITNANTTVQLPCATIATANQVIVTAGTRNVALHGCALRGGSNASGSQGGTVFQYSGTGAMVQVGDPTYAVNTMGFHMDNVVINTTASTSAAAQGLAAYRTQELDLESLYFLGNQSQTGMTLDGTGNYTGGTFYDNAFNGFATAVNAVGHQIANAATTDWMNASTFVRLHIDCPMSGGSPIGGTYGINLQQGDGNTFTGGDVEGCSTALHLGPNAQNNTIVGLRNENSTNQVVADAGSAYNNWMTGGTMFTGALTDNGTRNSFMDSFHRSFNGMNGDYYGSQKDATVTNHFRIGVGAGNERGLLNRYQTDAGYRWTTGLSDATGGEQYYQVLDELNNVYRLSIGQYNSGQSSTNNQTVINAAGTGAVVVNGSNNAGTGGLVIGSGGASESTVATISNAGNAQFNGTLQVGGATTFSATPTVKNQADAEIDETLQAGLTASQKESLIYKDWNGASQWYAEKDASNNWELNSATGGLDSIKAYQSTNSGDTYIDASNATGAVRINYETGAGTAFNIYGGNSSTLYASFSGTTTIKFPGLAAGSGHNCLQIDNSGYISNTGSSCSTGVGTVGSGNAGQIAYYTGSGTAIAGTSTVPLTAGGTGSATTTGALTNLGAFAYPGAAGIPYGLTTNSARQATAGDLTSLLGYTPLKPANNLSDVATPATALSNLGAVPAAGGTMTGVLTAPQFNGPLTGNVTGNVSGTAANVTGTVATANGGTGATTVAGAFTNIVAPGGTLTGALTAPQFNGPLAGNVTGNVSGTAANVTGTVATANGGTGATTAAGAFTNIVAPGGTLTGALTAPQFNGPLAGNVTGNATTATALAAAPAQCAANKYATGVSASGTATCTQVTYTQLSGTVPTWNQNTTGTASNVTGTVATANGGTGATTAAGAFTNIVAPGGTLTGALTAPQFNGPLTGNVTGNVSGTAANVTGTVLLGNGGTGATTAAGALAMLLPGAISDGANGVLVSGSGQFGGALQVGGATTFVSTPTVKNQADAEIDATLWAGLTASQKESLIYKDWNGNSQWYMQKDASNNWALTSATGGLDSIKAFQSTNSGDTYVGASNATGAVRVNYETGSGTAFNVYGGNSGSLLASFTAPSSVQFPGLAAGTGHNCLQVDSSGYITNTGSGCGSASSGSSITVSSANAGAVAYYSGNGTSISGMSAVPVTAGGTGATSAAAGLASLGGMPVTGGIVGTTAQLPTSIPVNVLAFGADPTGTNDSSTAVLAAASAASTNHGSVNTCERLYFPPGVYLVHEVNLSALSSCVNIEGTDSDAARIYYNGAGVAGEVPATITNTSVTGGVLTVTVAPMSTPYPVGSIVLLPALTNAANLSGFPVTVLSSTSTSFTANVAGFYTTLASAADSGTAMSDSYLFNLGGLSFGGWRHIRFYGTNYAGTVEANSLIIINSRVDRMVHMQDYTFASTVGDALALSTTGGVTNWASDGPSRFDNIGGYVFRISSNLANGVPFDLGEWTYDNASGPVSAVSSLVGYDGVHWGKGIVLCNNCSGVQITFGGPGSRLEMNRQLLPNSNGEAALVTEANTSPGGFLTVNLHHVTGSFGSSAGQRYPLVSATTQGSVILNTFANDVLYSLCPMILRDTGKCSGDRTSANTLTQYGQNYQETDGFEIGGQKITSGGVGGWSRWQAGDFAINNGLQVTPGQTGIGQMVVGPYPGWSSSVGTIISNGVITAGSPTVTWTSDSQTPPYVNDNLVLQGAGVSGANLNVLVTSVNYDATPFSMTVSPTPSTSVNPATISFQAPIVQQMGMDATRMSAAPTTGTWSQGNIVWNSNPATGVIGWACTASGTPGTWAAFPAFTVPAPTSSTLGGVNTQSCGANQHISSINGDGTTTCTNDAGSAAGIVIPWTGYFGTNWTGSVPRAVCMPAPNNLTIVREYVRSSGSSNLTGCTTLPVLSIGSESTAGGTLTQISGTGLSLALGATEWDSGAISVPVTSGTLMCQYISTASSGCTAGNAGGQMTVLYHY